jgi:hypothetical protein
MMKRHMIDSFEIFVFLSPASCKLCKDICPKHEGIRIELGGSRKVGITKSRQRVRENNVELKGGPQK